MSELILELHAKGKDAFRHTMEMMSSYFDIDGIAIYQGDDMKRIGAHGKYVNPIEALPQIRDKQYLDFFDEQGVYDGSNLKRLEAGCAELSELYIQQETSKLIQCVSLDGDIPKALVSFDFFNRIPKIGVIDMGFIKIIGRLMAEIAAKSEDK